MALEDFMSCYQSLLKELVDEEVLDTQIESRLKEIIMYNVPYQTEARGYMLVKAFLVLCPNPTRDQTQKSFVLGWLWQFAITAFVLVDDTLDMDMLRYGKCSWYSKNGKSTIVINDILLLQSATLRLLQKYFNNSPYYCELLNYFVDSIYSYSLGQNMDRQMSLKCNPTARYVSPANYERCAHLTACKPFIAGQIQLALIMAGHSKNGSLWAKVSSVCEQLAYFCVVGNDHEMFVKNTEIDKNIKKSDLVNGKATWAVINAKNQCNREDWKLLMQNLGKDNIESIKCVLNLYERFGMKKKSKTHLDEISKEICRQISVLLRDNEKIGSILDLLFAFYREKFVEL